MDGGQVYKGVSDGYPVAVLGIDRHRRLEGQHLASAHQITVMAGEMVAPAHTVEHGTLDAVLGEGGQLDALAGVEGINGLDGPDPAVLHEVSELTEVAAREPCADGDHHPGEGHDLLIAIHPTTVTLQVRGRPALRLVTQSDMLVQIPTHQLPLPTMVKTQAVQTNIVARVELVTPAIAVDWLETNTSNRRLNAYRVLRWTGAIERGEWKVNTDAIGFDSDGVLVNGQHRLRAVINAGIAVEMLVVRGLEPAVMKTLDIGNHRANGQLLEMLGHKRGGQLAAAASLHMRYESGEIVTADGSLTNNNKVGFTPEQLHAWAVKHPTVETDVLKLMATVRKYSYLSPTVGAAAYVLFDAVDNDQTEVFFEKLWEGADLAQANPILTLRRKLGLEYGRTRDGGRSAVSPEEWLVYTIKAWNAWRAGDDLSRLTRRKGEAIPKPQ